MITFYKLRHATDATKQCYVGSTKNFVGRKALHKHDCNNPNRDGHDIKVYKYVREHDGYDNWCFDVLEEKKDISKRDRHIREGVLIEQHHATLNVNDPAASVNGIPECQRRAARKYYNTHKEQARQRNKQRIDTNNTCEKCGNTYRGENKKNSTSTLAKVSAPCPTKDSTRDKH